MNKGLPQFDRLSLILYDIMANMSAIMFERTKNDGQIEVIIPRLLDGGLLMQKI
jgi:hypothetical protein